MIRAEDHIRLAYKIAMRFDPTRPIDDTETLGDALVGLTRAAQMFDESRGFQFTTYAWKVIAVEIMINLRRRNRRNPLFMDLADSSGFAPQCHRDLTREIERLREISTMRSHIQQLPLRHRTIIEARLAGRTLEDIGSQMGITKERVRQLEGQAIGWLRQSMTASGAMG